jgi:hypothetical protein
MLEPACVEVLQFHEAATEEAEAAIRWYDARRGVG